MRIFDTSSYCTGENVENFLVGVLPPSKGQETIFHILKGFSLVLNSSNLGYKKAKDSGELLDLHDGIYELSLSHKPNIHTLTKFYHLRVVQLLRKTRKQWAKLIDKECKLSREDFYSSRDKLREIDEYALAAKYQVEELGDKKKGKETYDFAQKLLEQYSHECKC